MRTPSFWSRPTSVRSRLLAPFSRLYDKRASQRFFHPPKHKAGVPVICIGNFTAGGAGKTPLTIALGKALQAKGFTPFVVTKGYGARKKGPLRVDPSTMSAQDVGDEPRLISRSLPVIMGKSRASAAQIAVSQGADVILLDDGFQSPDLYKDFAMIAVSSKSGLGNGMVLPSGPLRLSLNAQLKKTDAIVVISAPGSEAHPSLEILPQALVFNAAMRANADHLDKNKRYCAFAGIADPERFFTTARDLGLDLAETISYGDHHPFSAKDISLLRVRLMAGLTLLTTEKDAERLPANLPASTIPVEIDLPEEVVEKVLAYLRAA